eukprot:UN34091
MLNNRLSAELHKDNRNKNDLNDAFSAKYSNIVKEKSSQSVNNPNEQPIISDIIGPMNRKNSKYSSIVRSWNKSKRKKS